MDAKLALRLILLLSLGAFAAGCSDGGSAGIQGPAGPPGTGKTMAAQVIAAAAAAVPPPQAAPVLAMEEVAETVAGTGLPAQAAAASWAPDAERELRKIPFFVRGKARRNTEKFAQELGLSVITIETLYDAKAHFSR